MRIITGTLRSAPLPWLPVLSNIEPPPLRRKAAVDKLIEKGMLKMWDRKMRHQTARVENAAPICTSGNCRTGKCRKQHCMENHVLLMSPAKYKVQFTPCSVCCDHCDTRIKCISECTLRDRMRWIREAGYWSVWGWAHPNGRQKSRTSH